MQKIVSERAMMARINRRLAKEGQKLCKTPPQSRWFNDLGAFHIVNENQNVIEAQHVDLEELAKELGTLKPGEVLEE